MADVAREDIAVNVAELNITVDGRGKFEDAAAKAQPRLQNRSVRWPRGSRIRSIPDTQAHSPETLTATPVSSPLVETAR